MTQFHHLEPHKKFKDMAKTGPAHVRIVVKHCSTFNVGIEHGPTFADLKILKKIKGSQDCPTAKYANHTVWKQIRTRALCVHRSVEIHLLG